MFDPSDLSCVFRSLIDGPKQSVYVDVYPAKGRFSFMDFRSIASLYKGSSVAFNKISESVVKISEARCGSHMGWLGASKSEGGSVPSQWSIVQSTTLRGIQRGRARFFTFAEARQDHHFTSPSAAPHPQQHLSQQPDSTPLYHHQHPYPHHPSQKPSPPTQ